MPEITMTKYLYHRNATSPQEMAICRLGDRTARLTLLFNSDDRIRRIRRMVSTVLATVGNQRKWDTFVKERSGGYGSVVGLPEQVVVAFAAGKGLSFHLSSTTVTLSLLEQLPLGLAGGLSCHPASHPLAYLALFTSVPFGCALSVSGY